MDRLHSIVGYYFSQNCYAVFIITGVTMQTAASLEEFTSNLLDTDNLMYSAPSIHWQANSHELLAGIFQVMISADSLRNDHRQTKSCDRTQFVLT